MCKRKVMNIVVFVLGIISMLAGCSSSNDYDDIAMLTAEESISCIDELSVEYVSADFAIDINEATEVIGIAQPDGTLLISGPNSNILLDVQGKSDIVSNKTYKDYREFYKNEKKYDIEHFSSKYEE